VTAVLASDVAGRFRRYRKKKKAMLFVNNRKKNERDDISGIHQSFVKR